MQSSAPCQSQGRRCPGTSQANEATCMASQAQGARYYPRAMSQSQKRGNPVSVASVASTLKAETVTPPSSASLPSSKVFTNEDYKNFLKGYKSQVEEHDYWIEGDMIQGMIPKELSGTLLRNGPGLFEIGGQPVSQPLDGDGMVCSFAFKDGRVFFRNRFVRTAALLAEQAAQKMLYRGAFSVGNPSGGFFFNPFDFAVKGIANTSVLRWGSRLLALYERDLPYELDDRLHTLGQTDLGGSISNTAKAFFGAHHRIVAAPEGRRLIGFNFSEEPSGGLLNFFEYDERFRLLHKTTRLLKGATFGFFHDILATENYYIAVENPISMNFGKLLTSYMLGRACLAECLQFEERPTRVHLIPRPGTRASGQPERVFETDPFFSFHHVNAFEAPGHNKVVVDTCAMEGGINFSLSMENGSEAVFKRLAGRASPTRLVLDLDTGKVAKHTVVRDRAGELPSVSPAVNGAPSEHAYMAASRVVGPPHWGPQQMVLKVSLPTDWGVSTPSPDRGAIRQECWHPGDANFAQEPIFVPRPGGQAEDDGWVLTMVYNSGTERTELAILDAQQLSEGPVARICLPHHIPYGIHGSFSGDYLGPKTKDDAVSRTYNIMNGVADAQGRPKYS